MTQRSRIFLSLLLAVLFAAARLAHGQASTAGELTGTVADPSGAVIATAQLTITQASTGFSRTVTSNSGGGYDFPDLQAGQYVLKVVAAGFTDAQYDNVTVETGRTVNLNVQRKVG